MNHLMFVTGSSGAGKTTVAALVKKQSSSTYEVYDFDERLTESVAMEHRLQDSWRRETVRHWADVAAANASHGRKTVIFGLVYPTEVNQLTPTMPARFILLDCSHEELVRRLRHGRFSTPQKVQRLFVATGMTPEQFIDDNTSTVERLRSETAASGGAVIDTTDLTPEAVAQRIIAIIAP